MGVGGSSAGLSSHKVYLLQSNKRDEGIKKAAWQLEDALQGRVVDAYPSTPQARETHFAAAQAEHDYTIALVFLVLLTMFECPTWCNAAENVFTWVDGDTRCINYEGSPIPFSIRNSTTDETGPKVLLSNIAYIPPGVGLIVEVYLLCVIARKLLLERILQIKYFTPLDAVNTNLMVNSFGLLMVVLSMADSLIFAMYRGQFRLVFLFRSGLLATLPAVQNLGGCVAKVVGEFVSIAVFLIGTIVFFAWIFITLFQTLDDPVAERGPASGFSPNEGMDTFRHTLYTMFVAGISDEFTEMLKPSYTAYRPSGLLWLAMLIMVHVLLLNLVLDTLVAAYTNNSEQAEDEENEKKVEGIKKAFHSVARATSTEVSDARHHDAAGHNGGAHHEHGHSDLMLSKNSFLEFIEEFSRSPRMRNIPWDTAAILFSAIAPIDCVHDGHNWANEEHFCQICAVIEYDFWTTVKHSPVKTEFPGLWDTKWFHWLRRQVDPDSEVAPVRESIEDELREAEDGEHPSNFDNFMNAVLILNLLLVVWESMYDLGVITTEHSTPSGGTTNAREGEPAALMKLELIFSFVYVMEVGVKLCVISWPEYCSDRSNMFDFFVTWLLLGSSALEEFADAFANLGLKRYVNILRLLRLLRVMKQLKQLKEVQFMISTICQLVMASSEILTLLGVVVFFFTTLSVQIWGGLLYRENEALEGSEWDEQKYWVLNFNDFGMAFGTWFVILLCEYVPLFSEAIWRASSWPHSWTVFIVFYFGAVCIVFELVKAFTIELFLELKKEEKKGKNENEEFQGLQDVKLRIEQKGESLHIRPNGDSTKREKFREALKTECKGKHHEH